MYMYIQSTYCAFQFLIFCILDHWLLKQMWTIWPNRTCSSPLDIQSIYMYHALQFPNLPYIGPPILVIPCIIMRYQCLAFGLKSSLFETMSLLLQNITFSGNNLNKFHLWCWRQRTDEWETIWQQHSLDKQ